MENNTDVDYTHAKCVCKDFEINNLGEYYDLYVQRYKLLLGVFLRTLEIYVLNIRIWSC